MKIKNVFVALLFMVVSQKSMGIGAVVRVPNGTTQVFQIKQVYTGASQQACLVTSGQACSFKTGLHQLRGLIAIGNSGTFSFDFNSLGLRGTGDVNIEFSPQTMTMKLTGHKDMLFKERTAVNATIKGTKGVK